MLLPRWFHFISDKVAYWSRTVMVPLFILCTRKPVAKNPRKVHIRELFTTPPRRNGTISGARDSWPGILAADRLGRMIDPLIPARMREMPPAWRKPGRWRGSTAKTAWAPSSRHGQRPGSHGDTGLSGR